jgi:hypothetical protein
MMKHNLYKLALRIGLLAGMLCLLIFSFGCASYVTTIPSFGNQLVLELTYRGNIDMTNNRYFIVIGTTENFQIQMKPYEFIEPTEVPSSPPDLPNDNYFSYYQTWQSYFVSEVTGSLSLINGPFVTTEGYTRNPISNQDPDLYQITLTCPLSYIYGSAIPDKIYFNVVSVNNRYVKDVILPPVKYISKIKGDRQEGGDDVDLSIDSSLDLVYWRARIE